MRVCSGGGTDVDRFRFGVFFGRISIDTGFRIGVSFRFSFTGRFLVFGFVGLLGFFIRFFLGSY